MSILLWFLVYPIFFIAKMFYYEGFLEDGKRFRDRALWARIPLMPETYPMRDRINSGRPVFDWVIWGIVYTGMGPFAIAADLLVYILYRIDQHRFGW